jgi:hypothetical protein
MAHHQETLLAFDDLIRNRRLRIEFVSVGLPAPLWAVILIGALVTLGSAFFFFEVGGAAKINDLMVVLLSAIMGLLIFMIAYYDRPLRGHHGVSPEAYEVVHRQLMSH